MAPSDGTEAPTGMLATLFFTTHDRRPGDGHGFVVRFTARPVIGEVLEVDQYSIKQIPDEGLHRTRWVIVDVRHEVNLHPEQEADVPSTTLRVAVHPTA